MKKLITLLAVAFYFNINAQIITTVAGDSIGGYSGGYSGDGGLARAEQLNNPFGIAADQHRNLYIADMNNGRVRMVTTSTGIMTTIAGNGTYGYSGDNGAATAAELSTPFGVAVDGLGNVYIADRNNSVVRMVTPSGIISTFAGNGILGNTGDGGAANAAQLGEPIGIAVDGSGNVYIADYHYNCIRMVSANGNINTVAGTGSSTGGYSGDGGLANAAQLNNPTGVSVDASGNIYIADYANNCIRMVMASTGNINTIAGNNTQGYSGDGGQATAAQLYHPWNITTGSNNLYIADYANQVIRKVNSSGVISTIVGNNTQGYSGDCGNPTSAELMYPAGVALDTYGNLYIADDGNNRIRKVLFTAAPTHVTAHISKATICSGNTVIFTGGGASTYTWTGGVINNTPYTPSAVTASVNLVYTVTGTDTNQCMASASLGLTEYPPPIVSANSPTICVGQYAILRGGMITAAIDTAKIYSWTGGITNDVPFMTSSTSIYNVTGTDGNECSATISATVTVIQTTNPLPVISISSSPITTCGGAATLTASGANTYTWNMGSNNTSIVVTPTLSTIYSVSGSSFGCTVTNTITQVVNVITVTSNIDTLCKGSTAILTANNTVVLASNQAITYVWSLSSTPTVSINSTSTASINASPTVTTTYLVKGTFITYTVNNNVADTQYCVSGNTFTQNVRILNVSSNTDSLCNGSAAILTAVGASTYTWNPGSQNGASVSVTPTNTTSAASIVTYTVIGAAQTCTVMNTIKQIIKAPLHIMVSSNIDSICVGGTATLTVGGANSYIWSTTQTGTSIVVTPTVATNYLVNGTINGCSAMANFTENIDTACFEGIKQNLSIDNQISIYPNPANGSFMIAINNNSIENTTIVVLNALGQKVFETKGTGQLTQIALPNCLPGVYYVQINTGTNRGVKKVIIN